METNNKFTEIENISVEEMYEIAKKEGYSQAMAEMRKTNIAFTVTITAIAIISFLNR